METQDIYEIWHRETVEQGIEQGIEQGVRKSLVKLYQARFGAMPENLRAIVEDTHDEATLLTWLQFAGMHGANEVAAAIRSFRAS